MSAANATLQRKVKKAVAPYDEAVVGGLRELSEFYGPNTAAARRGLRGAIERRGLAINRELLGAFEPLLRELDAVDAEADSLSDACASIATRLREARASTEVLLAATARLREDSRLNERRQELCELFEREFMLSDAEESVLNAPADAEVELEPLLARPGGGLLEGGTMRPASQPADRRTGYALAARALQSPPARQQ